MKAKKLKLKSTNLYVNNGLIPLGINTWRGNKEKKHGVVAIPYKKNGSIVIIGTSGWGKSVLLKRIIDYVLGFYSGQKAGLIIDPQGVDLRLLKYPNNVSRLFFKGEVPRGIQNIKNYVPIFAAKRALEDDKIWGLGLNDLMPRDLANSLQINAIKEFMKIKHNEQNRELMRRPDRFFEEFERLPTSSRTGSLKSRIIYPDNNYINFHTKQTLITNFANWQGFMPEDNEKPDGMPEYQWDLQKKMPYFVDQNSEWHRRTFWEEYNWKKVIVNNFMDFKEDREAMAIYGGYLLRDIYDYCCTMKQHNRYFGGAFVCVEEGNLFDQGYYMTELLCRGFKFEVFIVANFQSIHNVNEDIREHLTSGNNLVLLGNLNRRDRDYLSYIFPDIKDLKLRENVPNLDWGAREWVLYYNDREYDTFVPYPSLSMYHERG